MAYPTIRSTSNGSITAPTLEVTITLPTGHAAGDLLIIGLSLDGSRTVSAPSGWELLANPTNSSANRFPIWYKVRGSSESNPTLTWLTTGELGTWFAIAITAETYMGTPEIATVYGNNTNPNAPSLTPSWGSAETLWFAFHGWDYNRTSTTNPTNYTLLTYQAGSGTGSAGHRTHYRNNTTATEDPGSITISETDTWYAHTLAVQPYVAPPDGLIAGNIGGTWRSAVGMFVRIDGGWRLVSEVNVNIGGTWKPVTTYQTSPTEWVLVDTTTPGGTVDYIFGSASCPTSNQCLTWLNANYPASSYSFDYIIRVRRWTSDYTACSPDYYFKAQ